MQIRCESVAPGAVPSEAVVAIKTSEGHAEEVVVHTSLVEGDKVRVSGLARREKTVLIQLPRESVQGNWRLWVPDAIVA